MISRSIQKQTLILDRILRQKMKQKVNNSSKPNTQTKEKTGNIMLGFDLQNTRKDLTNCIIEDIQQFGKPIYAYSLASRRKTY